MMLTLNLESPVPLTDQVADGIRQAIAAGQLFPGDVLPTVRQLANDLDINFNTVARAYRELERRGLVSTVRGRGTVVTSSTETPALPPKESEQRAVDAIRRLLTEIKLSGVSRATALRMFVRELDTLFGEGGDAA